MTPKWICVISLSVGDHLVARSNIKTIKALKGKSIVLQEAVPMGEKKAKGIIVAAIIWMAIMVILSVAAKFLILPLF